MLLSGLAITAELNTLLNEVYQIYIFSYLTHIHPRDVYSHVEIALYGDDSLMAPVPSIHELYNSTTVCKAFLEVLDMVVTPAANKNGVLSDFVHISEASFLKRGFSSKPGRIDAPLNLESMYNSIQYYEPRRGLTQEDLLASKLNSFMFELSHYSHEVYTKWIWTLRTVAAKHSVVFKPYDYATCVVRRTTEYVEFQE
jgi:hypothetical protein